MGSELIVARALTILIYSCAFYWQYFACDQLYPMVDRKLPQIYFNRKVGETAGLVDEWGRLIFLIYQNTIEPIAQWLLPLINGMITHSLRKFGGEK